MPIGNHVLPWDEPVGMTYSHIKYSLLKAWWQGGIEVQGRIEQELERNKPKLSWNAELEPLL